MAFLLSSCFGEVQFPNRRIINGEVAKPGNFRYFVFVNSHHPADIGGLCGGGLIDLRFVITAAHCVHDALKVECYFPVAGKKNPRQAMHVEAEKIIVHEQFNSKTLENDIALLEIPMFQRAKVKPIFLVLPEANESFEGEVVEVAGLGRYNYNTSGDVLRNFNPVVTNLEDCQESYKKNRLRKVRETNICAMMQPNQSLLQAVCIGDSGGPLVLIRNGRYIVIGLVSRTPRLCNTQKPQVFTRVSTYTDWIKEKIKKNQES